MAISRSKAGVAVGDGGGNFGVFPTLPRYAKFLDASGVAYAPQGVRAIYRQVRGDDAQLLAEGRAGGQRMAHEQLAILGGNAGKVWGVEGQNEVIPSNNPAQAKLAGEVALGHAEVIQAAGKVPIEFNIAVGNVEQVDAQALAPYVQSLWASGAMVGYHSYFDQNGPSATWGYLAGRYQQITAWLRAAGVAATPLWAITEAGYDAWGGNPLSGPVWDLIELRGFTEAQAMADMVRLFQLLDADPLVAVVTPFTYWHQSDPRWKRFDLAVRPNGQAWLSMLGQHANYFATPGAVNDPPGGSAPPPPPSLRYRVKASSTPYANLRTGPGTSFDDIGDLYPGTTLAKIMEGAGWYQVQLDTVVNGTGRAVVKGWVLGSLLEIAP